MTNFPALSCTSTCEILTLLYPLKEHSRGLRILKRLASIFQIHRL